MYNVAQVIDEKCVAKKGCRLCIMYCPEANCLDLNPSKMVAEVIIDRCDVDVGPARDLAQGGASEAKLGEQLFRCREDPVLGGKASGDGHGRTPNQTLV